MPIALTNHVQLKAAQINAKYCVNCPLCTSRNTVVYGYGNIYSRHALVGEAPGKIEDKLGLPFCGKSGEFLRSQLAKLGVSLADCYVFNSVLCRPPNNRRPTASELNACREHINTMLRLCYASTFITFGLTATRTFLPTAKLTDVLGVCHTLYDGRIVIPNYHPAYVLRTPTLQKQFRRILRKGISA